MESFYSRFGRRVALPSTVEILDELDPDYRKRLVREGRVRPNLPRAFVLPALTQKPLGL
jgi:hypothetical protein